MVNVSLFSVSIQLDSAGRQWLVLAATVDYHPMAKILLTNSHLVKQKVGFMSKIVEWNNITLLCFLFQGYKRVFVRLGWQIPKQIFSSNKLFLIASTYN